MNELIYGIRKTDQRIVSIDEIPNHESGRECNCHCVACDRPLQACSLNGKVRRYFRHHVENRDGTMGGGCNTVQANETALHQMAKQILVEEKIIFVPSVHISLSSAGIHDLPQHIINCIPAYEFHEGMIVVGESVDMEKSIEQFRPDVVVKTKRGEVLVEFYVRHRVDDDKKEKVVTYGSAMLEIDLRSFVETPICRDKLREIIVSKTEFKEWIYYPLSENALKKAREYYESLQVVKVYRESLREQERRRAAELKQKQRQDAARERGRDKIKKLFEPSNYAAELDRLRNDEAFLKASIQWHRPYWYHFGHHFQSHRAVPFFVDIPITGEMIFQCDRRIWQSILFNRFVYGRKQDHASFTIEKFFDILKDEYEIKIDYDLTYKLPDPRHENEEIKLRQTVVETYVDYLETLGFVMTAHSRAGYGKRCWKTVQARRTIIPPDKQATDHLLNAVKRVDLRSPNVDDLIFDQMSEYYEEKRRQVKEAEEQERRQRIERSAAESDRRAQELKRPKISGIQWMYDCGLQDVIDCNFDEPVNRYDRFDQRWFRCTDCAKIKQRDEMEPESYEFGRGLCKACNALKSKPKE